MEEVVVCTTSLGNPGGEFGVFATRRARGGGG
mgnify:CR=1 FL=1